MTGLWQIFSLNFSVDFLFGLAAGVFLCMAWHNKKTILLFAALLMGGISMGDIESLLHSLL